MDNPISALVDAVKGFASGAMRPEKLEPGPGDVGPSINTKLDAPSPQKKLVTMQMSAEETKQWWERVKRARERVKQREQVWDILLKEYLPLVKSSGEAETVKVQAHFRNVHSKIGNLFYRSPDLILTPREPSPADNAIPNPMGQQLPPLKMEDVVSVKQAVLQAKLGRDGIKASRLMDELLFDVLAWAGIGTSKLGYKCHFRVMQKPRLQPDPMAASITPGAILGLGAAPPEPPMVPVLDAAGQPVMDSIPVPVYEEWYWRRFSPKKWLCNDDLRSTRYDEDATWMGMEFFMSPKVAMKVFGLSEQDAQRAASDDRVFQYAEDKSSDSGGLVRGVELWVKASHFTDEPHPQVMYQLVLIDGIEDRPIVWRMSPDQQIDEQGKLTKDSLIGFPIRVLAIRDMADSPFPLADSAFTNSEIKQLSTWLRQSIQIRDAAIGKYLYDMEAFDDAEIKKLESTDVGVHIGVKPGMLANQGKDIYCTTAQIHQSPDDYRGQQILKQNVDETLGISSTGAGAQLDTVRTATEVANMMSSMQGRNDKELARTLDFYLDGARMVDQLIMRYATEDDYIEITGLDGSKRMQLWNNQIVSGKYLYDIAPDSMVKIDTARDFQLDTQHWNLVAKSPLTNQEYLLRRLARKRGMDPAKAVYPKAMIDAQMAQSKEPPVKLTLSLGGEDLANPLVVKLLVDQGVIKPEDVALNKPVMPEPPEGAADKADVISQHTASNSGGSENSPSAGGNFREGQAGD